MNILELKSYLDTKNLSAIEQMMFTSTGNYQVFNPFSDPITPKDTSLTRQKLDDMKYQPEEFRGKTVADLGCNLGFFSFVAMCHGAKRVTAYDINPECVLAGNLLRDSYERDFPRHTGKLNFEQMDFKSLPDFPTYDVLLVHSLIHWFFVFMPLITMSEIAAWLARQCNEAVYFEGCVEASEPVMVQNKVSPERLNQKLFLEEMQKQFTKVDVKGRMSYNPQRIVARFYK